MSPDVALPQSGTGAAVLPAWRGALIRLVLLWLACAALAAREWGEMAHQWWDIDTYHHILIIPPILAWLVWLRREDLAQIAPRGWWPGLGLFVAGLSLWLFGRWSGLNLLAHAGAVGMTQASVLALLGPRVAGAVLLPLGFAAFLVPFGDEIIPQLQMVTARIAIALTHWSGVEAVVDGIHIATPAGLFIVAEECSGVKFLIAMIALGVLVCFTAFTSWRRRAAFMVAAVTIPILANGVRAWGTIYVAQYVGAERAGGFDHLVYGWIFFAIVIAILIGGAWRFFERDPEDSGYSLHQIEESPLLARLDALAGGGGRIMASALAFAAVFALAAIYAAPPLG